MIKSKKTINEKFKYAVKRGSGEAYLIMKQNPQINFSNEIIRSVITTNAFDAQSEGTREKYYYDLISISVNKDALISRIINLLSKKRKDVWAIEQLFRLCAFFAKDGNKYASSTVYEQFSKKKVNDTPWLGEEAIIYIDGFKGILFLVQYYGKIIRNEPNEYISTDFLYYLAQSRRSNYLLKLKEYSKQNIYVKVFLERYFERKKDNGSYNTKVNYNYIKQKINSGQPFYIWRKRLSSRLINKISDEFVKEQDIKNKINYLRFFRSIQFPYNPKYILEIIKRIKSNKNREIEIAVDALKLLKSTEIRDFAISKLKSTTNSRLYLDLLVKNYKKGDANIIYNIVKKQNTPDKAHSVIWSITDIYYKNKVKECKKIMEFLYSHLACGSHRYDVAKILKMNNVLSKNIRKEIRFDSYLKTRKLAN